MPVGKIKNPHWIKKTCLYCGKTFDYYKTSSSERLACPECIPDSEKHNASLKRMLVKKKAVEEKGSKCALCGNTYPLQVYDFHHINPNEKDFNLGNKHATVKWDIVKQEIDKCLLLCANCHRLIHSGDVQIDVGNDGQITVLTGKEWLQSGAKSDANQKSQETMGDECNPVGGS